MGPMEWVPFANSVPGQRLPPERRLVLVQVVPRKAEGLPAAVAVGYVRIWSSGPFFVIPGVGGEVTAWCDCLGDDFAPACWSFPRMNQLNREPAVWDGPE
jgi:hypothetical protein